MKQLPKITFIFPIYKKSEYLIHNIQKILEDKYPSELKEIIISIDMPEEDFKKALDILKNFKNVKIVISYVRRGKVNATMEDLRYSTGDIIISVDSDAKIEKIDLYKLVNELEEVDILDFYKEILPSNWIGKVMYMEYMLYYQYIGYFVNKYKKSITMNGGAFAIKRDVWEKVGGYSKVYVEDIDLCLKVMGVKGRIKVSDAIFVSIKPLDNLSQLISQKIRWTFSIIEVINYHFKDIVEISVRYPLLIISFIGIISIPFIFWLYLLIFLPINYIYVIGSNLYNSMVGLSPIYLLVFSPFDIYRFLYFIFSILALIFTQFIFILVLDAIKRKKVFNLVYYLLFVTFYVLLYDIALIYNFLYYLIFERAPIKNWKV